MPQLLNQSSSLLCPHGGQVNIITANARSKAAGAFLIRKTDTFVIAGCPLNVSGAPHPCVTVEWTAEAGRSQSSGAAQLHSSSVGLCKATDGAVQGTVQVVNTQAKVQGL